MVVRRHQQRTIYEELARNVLPDYKERVWEKEMVEVDRLLEDDELIDIVYEALKRRHPESGRRGRLSTPAEVVLRMLVLKHMRNWSYEELVREVRANLVYREFTRIGTNLVPDDKTMVKLGLALGPPGLPTTPKATVDDFVDGQSLQDQQTSTGFHKPSATDRIQKLDFSLGIRRF